MIIPASADIIPRSYAKYTEDVLYVKYATFENGSANALDKRMPYVQKQTKDITVRALNKSTSELLF